MAYAKVPMMELDMVSYEHSHEGYWEGPFNVSKVGICGSCCTFFNVIVMDG